MLPTCGLNDHVTAVFPVPTTADVNVALWPSFNVTLAGDKLRPTGVSVTVAVALFVESTTLVAVTVTVCWLLMEAGAVYIPFAMLPTAGLRDQVTPALLVPVTAAEKFAEAPAPSDIAAGPTVTPTGVNHTSAVAVLDVSAMLVAVTVTLCALAITAGA
jgi:hypothetical protein